MDAPSKPRKGRPRGRKNGMGGNKTQVTSMKEWHYALIDYIVAKPTTRVDELAKIFGVSYQWMSLVKNSDLFKEELEKRRTEAGVGLAVSLREQTLSLADMTVEKLSSRVEREGDTMKIDDLRNIAETAFKALGQGGHRAPTDPPASAVQVNVIQSSTLDEARQLHRSLAEENSKRLQEQKKLDGPVVEHESVPAA